MPTYIVLWTEIDNYDSLYNEEKPRQEVDDSEVHIDYWHACEDYESATDIYNDLIDQGERIITCSVCVPVLSTDYEEVTINV